MRSSGRAHAHGLRTIATQGTKCNRANLLSVLTYHKLIAFVFELADNATNNATLHTIRFYLKAITNEIVSLTPGMLCYNAHVDLICNYRTHKHAFRQFYHNESDFSRFSDWSGRLLFNNHCINAITQMLTTVKLENNHGGYGATKSRTIIVITCRLVRLDFDSVHFALTDNIYCFCAASRNAIP